MTGTSRYKIVFLNGLDGLCSIEDTEAEIPTFYNDLGYINHIKPVCDKLNEQDQLIYCLKTESDKYKILFSRKEMDYINLRRTHMGLKDEIKELSGIRCDLIRELNKKDERIKELEEYIDCIDKSFADYYGMSMRNAEWFGFKGDVE